MYDTTIQEMSAKIFEVIQPKDLKIITEEEIFKAIKSYWEDKIAITWELQDVDAVLIEVGHDENYMSRNEKIDVLARVLDHHDAEYGVSWGTLRCATEDEILRKNKTQISIEMP